MSTVDFPCTKIILKLPIKLSRLICFKIQKFLDGILMGSYQEILEHWKMHLGRHFFQSVSMSLFLFHFRDKKTDYYLKELLISNTKIVPILWFWFEVFLVTSHVQSYKQSVHFFSQKAHRVSSTKVKKFENLRRFLFSMTQLIKVFFIIKVQLQRCSYFHANILVVSLFY